MLVVYDKSEVKPDGQYVITWTHLGNTFSRTVNIKDNKVVSEYVPSHECCERSIGDWEEEKITSWIFEDHIKNLRFIQEIGDDYETILKKYKSRGI